MVKLGTLLVVVNMLSLQVRSEDIVTSDPDSFLALQRKQRNIASERRDSEIEKCKHKYPLWFKPGHKDQKEFKSCENKSKIKFDHFVNIQKIETCQNLDFDCQ